MGHSVVHLLTEEKEGWSGKRMGGKRILVPEFRDGGRGSQCEDMRVVPNIYHPILLTTHNRYPVLSTPPGRR